MKENWWKLLLILAVVALAILAFYISSNCINKEPPKNPVATITLASGEVIKVELYPNKAPNTVKNFISLANSGFYDSVILHRIAKGFVLQGGDPEGTGMGGPGYMIAGEFADNDFARNDIAHVPGVISMARGSHGYDTAGSQFFIVVGDEPFVRKSLDNQYAAFGKTVDEESLAICMELSNAEVGERDRPIDPPVIETIRVETFGVTYPEPEKITN